MYLTAEQWAHLGRNLGARLAAERRAADERQLVVSGALQLLARELPQPR